MNAKLIRTGLQITLLFAGIAPALSQGTFQNLDFEQLTPSAIPAWTSYIGTNQVNGYAFNTIALDAAAISVHDSRSPVFQPLSGNISVFLQGASRFASEQVAAALGQTGQIPANARSVSFFSNPLPSTSLQLTFNGQSIPLFPLGATPTFRVFGGDISAFAGQTGELRITAPPGVLGLLDHIQFLSTPVPEPGAWALFGLGSALLWCAAKRKRN